MKKIILLGVIMLLFYPAISRSQSRVNFRLDTSGRTISAFDKEESFSWQAWQVDFEQEWAKNKLFLSGFDIGFRKEGKVFLYDGTYLVFGTFRRLNSGNLAFYANADVLYGFPGLRFNRAWEKRSGIELVSYTKLYFVRNAGIPGMIVGKAGVVYPELSVTLRRKLGRFNIDGIAGVRLMKFGIIESDFNNSLTDTKLVPIPTLGLRAGFH